MGLGVGGLQDPLLGFASFPCLPQLQILQQMNLGRNSVTVAYPEQMTLSVWFDSVGLYLGQWSHFLVLSFPEWRLHFPNPFCNWEGGVEPRSVLSGGQSAWAGTRLPGGEKHGPSVS